MTADKKSPRIMGILNITPDSFSGDGLLQKKDYIAAAVDSAARMIEEGADILDIGGESSRPGAERVSAEEEIRRVVPVIEAICKKFPAIPIAVDTTKAAVAEAALKAGATIINDISALGDKDTAPLAAKTGAFVVLMDNRGDAANIAMDQKIGGEYRGMDNGDIIGDVTRHLTARAAFAEKSGIARDKIILDPGLGFGKTVEQNLALIREVGQLKALGYPVLLGPSRKSFIGRALDLPVEERLEGTAALIAIGAFLGADILRVHDVKFMARVVKMAVATRK
jgi:dihydropteroate synthase